MKPCAACSRQFEPADRRRRYCSAECRNLGTYGTYEDKFWQKVNKLTGDRCWEWVGARNAGGYGLLMVDGRLRPAHRLSYEFNVEEIPVGMNVCHRCDNRLCVNPAHLFVGSTKDNMADKVSKGRQARGENDGNAKLNAHHVARIRSLRNRGRAYQSIANEYGVSRTNVRDICLRRTWKHVA